MQCLMFTVYLSKYSIKKQALSQKKTHRLIICIIKYLNVVNNLEIQII